jgi:hypothetical protein
VSLAVPTWVALAASLATSTLPESVTSMQMRNLSSEDESTDTGPEAPRSALPEAPLRRTLEPLPAEPAPRRPHYTLAVLETAAFVGMGTVWYWRNAQFNSRDWDLGWDWPSWKQKATFTAPRFDDNTYDTNAFWHPLDGAGLFLVARGNHLTPLQSLGMVAAQSVVWEYAVEFREYPSVNDMIFTPMAAISLAEPAVRVASLLRAGSGGPVSETLAAVLDPVGAANALFEGRHDRSHGGTDAMGLPLEYRHRLELFLGAGQSSFGAGRESSTNSQMGVDLFVDSTPGYGRPGRRSGLVGTGTLAFLRGGASIDDRNLAAANVEGKVAMGGALWRNFEPPDGSRPRGRTVFLGLASGFDYFKRTNPLLSEDRVANVRVLGPMVDWSLARGAFNLHVQGDATWDFAMVTPVAGDAFLSTASTQGLPTVVVAERYYYAQGLSLRARAIATLGPLETGIDLGEDDFRPLNVLDRNDAPSVPGTTDRRARRRLWVGLRPWPTLPFMATVAAHHVTTEGSMGGARVAASELRGSTALSLIF